MHLIVRFARTYMTRYLWWYLAGVLCLVGTNYLSVTIPLYLAEGIDLLEASLLRAAGGDGAVSDPTAAIEQLLSEGATIDAQTRADVSRIAGIVAASIRPDIARKVQVQPSQPNRTSSSPPPRIIPTR